MSAAAIKALNQLVPVGIPDEDLLDEDGEPLETDWHRLAMNLLIDVTACHLQDRQDYFVGGNMFIYYREKRTQKRRFRGPDFFLVWGVAPRPARRFWAVWNEGGHFPDVIIELASPTTIKIDQTIKKKVYEKTFRTHEYFIYDPDKQKLHGWRLTEGRYQPIAADANGRLSCEELGLSLGTWHGRFLDRDELYLRFFDQEGRVAPTYAEAANKVAEEATQRAEKAEAELARLRTEHGGNGRRKK
jgi:Uma2 family endonuclease